MRSRKNTAEAMMGGGGEGGWRLGGGSGLLARNNRGCAHVGRSPVPIFHSNRISQGERPYRSKLPGTFVCLSTCHQWHIALCKTPGASPRSLAQVPSPKSYRKAAPGLSLFLFSSSQMHPRQCNSTAHSRIWLSVSESGRFILMRCDLEVRRRRI